MARKTVDYRTFAAEMKTLDCKVRNIDGTLEGVFRSEDENGRSYMLPYYRTAPTDYAAVKAFARALKTACRACRNFRYNGYVIVY